MFYLLQLMRLLAILSCLMSTRLAYVFNKLKFNAKNKQVIPLANVMFVKSTLFAIMTGLVAIELATINVIGMQSQMIQNIHWAFGLVFLSLLFAGQMYLYWLAEFRNGWH